MKISIDKKTLLFTHPVLVIGSYDMNNKPNIATVSWGGICCSEPPSVAISLRKSRYTYNNIMLHKAFTVNIPSEKYIKEADYAGIYSGRDENKFEKTGLTAVNSKIINAPYVQEFPLSLICKVSHINEIGIHVQFVGEILDILADEEIIEGKKTPNILKAKPYIYDSASRRYYGIGNYLLDAYSQVKEK